MLILPSRKLIRTTRRKLLMGGAAMAAASALGIGEASAAISASIASVVAQATGSGAFTSGAIDTSGANFLMFCIGGSYNVSGLGVLNATISDSKSNTWVQVLATQCANSNDAAIRVWTCFNPTVGGGHTFSVTSTSSFATIVVDARSGVFSGAITASNYTGSVLSGGGQLGPTLTPPDSNSLLYCMASDSSAAGVHPTMSGVQPGGFSTTPLQFGNAVSGQAYSLSVWSQIQGAIATSNPLVNVTSPSNAFIYSFKPTAGGGGSGPPSGSLMRMGVGR